MPELLVPLQKAFELIAIGVAIVFMVTFIVLGWKTWGEGKE